MTTASPTAAVHRLRCGEVWGGVPSDDVDACSAAINASLFSLACDGGGAGGDIYYFSVCTADSLTRVVVADVVGHGAGASRVSEWLYAAMLEQMNSLDGGGVLDELNRAAAGRGIGAMTTAAVAAFYRHDSRFYFSYAGHHPILLLRRGRNIWEPVALGDVHRDGAEGTAANLPLGIFPDVTYTQQHIALEPGDRFAVYTDGVIEAPDADGVLFGGEHLHAVLNANARRPLREIKYAVLDAVRRHTGGSLQHDDVTLLLAEVR